MVWHHNAAWKLYLAFAFFAAVALVVANEPTFSQLAGAQP